MKNTFFSLSLIAETKQCIYDNAQYCERSVGELLLQEMALLVGERGQACEVTLPACLRTLMMSGMFTVKMFIFQA